MMLDMPRACMPRFARRSGRLKGLEGEVLRESQGHKGQEHDGSLPE